MSADVITVENLGKQYFLTAKREDDGLRHSLETAVRAPVRWLMSRGRAMSAAREAFWALRDVSFTVARGEAIGVVGRNGAGKSTMLRLLSRITEPTTGRIRYTGRVSSLLEVGTGFHPELSGRENIYLNAAILGMRRADIRRRFDEIVAFSEVERFLDTPVKRYSSGMYVRLAFGVAAHLEPDILIVDEVLAVGDAAFQRKCLGKMGSVVHEGRTVIFVSHNMGAVRALCNRALLIEGGRLEQSGTPDSVIGDYLARSRANITIPLGDRTDREGDGALRFTSVTFRTKGGESADTVTSGQDMSIVLDYAVSGQRPLSNVTVQVKFASILGQPLFACLSRASNRDALDLPPTGRAVCRIPCLPLMPGTYAFSIWASVGDHLADLVREVGTLSVVDGDFFGTGKLPPNTVGDFLVPHSWSIEQRHPETAGVAECLNVQ